MNSRIFITVLFGASLSATATDPLPRLQGELPMSPGAAFQFGPRKDGIRIGLSTQSAEYRLNHRINVWQCIDTEKPYPKGHTLMHGDPLYKDSFIAIITPDGAVTKLPTGGPIDGPEGMGWGGGCSGALHEVIRKPGVYKLQWRMGEYKSGTITFNIVPE